MNPHRIDPEWLAFRAGLRPAIRLTLEPEWLQKVSERFEKMGACVAHSQSPVEIDGRTVWIAYVAHEEEVRDELAAAEAPLFTRADELSIAEKMDRQRVMGRLLGYPDCCVESFCRWSSRGVGRLEDGGKIVAGEHYTAAFEAWVARPNPQLNDLLTPFGVRWVSFYPCRYDCPEGGKLAARIAQLAHEQHGDVVLEYGRYLERAVVIGKWGQRAWVQMSEEMPDRIADATAPPGRSGQPDERDQSFAEQLKGRLVTSDGKIDGMDTPAPILLAFGDG